MVSDYGCDYAGLSVAVVGRNSLVRTNASFMNAGRSHTCEWRNSIGPSLKLIF
jgi:hypothetical protein